MGSTTELTPDISCDQELSKIKEEIRNTRRYGNVIQHFLQPNISLISGKQRKDCLSFDGVTKELDT